LPLTERSSQYARAETAAARCRLRTQAATLSASGDTRANTNAGVGPTFTGDVLVARSVSLDRVRTRLVAETHRRVQ
jgi:hypothetical protein